VNSNVIHSLAELCALKGVRNVVVCPGSRSAPLTLAFLRNKLFTCRTFSDERSAAFIALAMAQQTKKPVALICTSGSAAYNFAPAVAESFFQQIPLLVFTADRPKEWIDQLDGQTIRQQGIFGHHVKRSYELPQDYSHADSIWHANRIVNEAVNLAEALPQGPVHINAPFREPLYPATASEAPRIIPRNMEVDSSSLHLSDDQWVELVKSMDTFRKILIVPGQQVPSQTLLENLTAFYTRHHCPLAGDILSNFHGLPFFCRHADTILGQPVEANQQALQPDLIITFGKSLVAKNLKLFLRAHKPAAHWHLQPEGEVADTFQSLTRIIRVSPDYFFAQVTSKLNVNNARQPFATLWEQHETRANHAVKTFMDSQAAGEFAFLSKVLREIPTSSNLHLANSMSVRYANLIGLLPEQQGVTVYSNRGTSGIDGCSSTAVGHALTSDNANVLITGDQAFFYDRNAFWHNYSLPNLFVVLINNHGGIIFNMINGPAHLPEAEEFFITRQALHARPLAAEFGFSHEQASTTSLPDFFTSNGNVKILEMESDQALNKKIFETFKKQIKKTYED